MTSTMNTETITEKKLVKRSDVSVRGREIGNAMNTYLENMKTIRDLVDLNPRRGS